MTFRFDYPKNVTLGDITIRDGFQHEEKFISTDAKVYYAEQLILAGFGRLEVTNLGNPFGMPQFKDADDVLRRIRESKLLKKAGVDVARDVEITAVTIREKSVDRAVALRKEGIGPDRILMMVSTDEEHHFANSGLTLPAYWREAERCIAKAKEVGMKFNGTVSTIWGSPISGPTYMRDAIAFTQRWLDMGADDVEHADHDGSASPDQVYRYYSMLMEFIPRPEVHLAHFHVTRGWGLANVLAALQAGVCVFESTIGGLGGQPATFVGDTPVQGTGDYYYNAEGVGLVSTEDMVLMMEEMGINTGIDIERLFRIGRNMEKTIGRRLRSSSILHGRIPKEPNDAYRRKVLHDRKESLGEKPGQRFPE
jgi:hydroxymethylglutaryl-CoA lyase